MAIVSVAILISFHLKHQPTETERRVALPFGIIFWLLALACLVSGLSNYIKTVTKYSQRQALVQSGWKTQVVSRPGRSVVRERTLIDLTGIYRCGCCDCCSLRFVSVHECYKVMNRSFGSYNVYSFCAQPLLHLCRPCLEFMYSAIMSEMQNQGTPSQIVHTPRAISTRLAYLKYQAEPMCDRLLSCRSGPCLAAHLLP